jgi:hypothetical protein
VTRRPIITIGCCVYTHAALQAAALLTTDTLHTAHYTLADVLQEPAAAGDDDVQDQFLPDAVSDVPHIVLHRWGVHQCVSVCNLAYELWHKPWLQLCRQQLQEMRQQLQQMHQQLLTVLTHAYCAAAAVGSICITLTLWRGFAGPPVRDALIRHSCPAT